MAKRIIGLTGGIATGKSTVASWLAETGIPVADADLLAREAVQPGSRILAQIEDRYGATVLQANGELDRRKLGEVIFADESERRWLESQIHPYVRNRMQNFVETLPESSTAVLVIPLLFEAGLEDSVTEIWTVICSQQQQLTRLQARNGLNREEAQARIDAQWPLQKKAIRSTVAIDNSGELGNTYWQTQTALAADSFE